MIKRKLTILFSFLIIGSLISCQSIPGNQFTLTSKDIKNNSIIDKKHIFNSFGCKGSNISPQLSWKNAPKETKSFALTVYDPDAPTGSGCWHWIVLNIPNHYDKLSSNFGKKEIFRFKNGIMQIKNDYGLYSFGGPCPPEGDKDHHYIFTIYALKTDKIILNRSASAAKAGFMINNNTIAKASFIAKYSR